MPKSMLTVSIDVNLIELLRVRQENISGLVNDFLKSYLETQETLSNSSLETKENLAREYEIKLKTIKQQIEEEIRKRERKLEEKAKKDTEEAMKKASGLVMEW